MHTASGNASSVSLLHLQFFSTFTILVTLNNEGNGTQINAIFLGYVIHTHTHTCARAHTQEADSRVKLIY